MSILSDMVEKLERDAKANQRELDATVEECGKIDAEVERLRALVLAVKVRGDARGIGGTDSAELPAGWEAERNELLGDKL